MPNQLGHATPNQLKITWDKGIFLNGVKLHRVYEINIHACEDQEQVTLVFDGAEIEYEDCINTIFKRKPLPLRVRFSRKVKALISRGYLSLYTLLYSSDSHNK